MGEGHDPFPPAFGQDTLPSFPFLFLLLKLTISQRRCLNLLLSLRMVLLSPPTPTNTQICSGRYAVVAEVPTAS